MEIRSQHIGTVSVLDSTFRSASERRTGRNQVRFHRMTMLLVSVTVLLVIVMGLLVSVTVLASTIVVSLDNTRGCFKISKSGLGAISRVHKCLDLSTICGAGSCHISTLANIVHVILSISKKYTVG